jgi:hypothetical protein
VWLDSFPYTVSRDCSSLNGFCFLSSIVLLVASFAVSWIRKFPKIEK